MGALDIVYNFAKNKNKQVMEKQEKEVNALLIHIEHSNPIEINEFTTTLNAVGNLFSMFAQEKGECKELSQAKLYVEKIEQGCIDIFLTETVTAGLIPFFENMNIILDFSLYLKTILEYFTEGKGEEPELKVQEAKNLRDMLNVVSGDNKGEMQVGAINKGDKKYILNNCTINFFNGNSAQNQLEKRIDKLKEIQQSDEVYSRQLMTIYQMRSDMSSDTGNKAVIDALSSKKLGVVFETDELKERILNSEYNPAKKAFLVDVELLTAGGKLAAYKVLALHDVIDLE